MSITSENFDPSALIRPILDAAEPDEFAYKRTFIYRLAQEITSYDMKVTSSFEDKITEELPDETIINTLNVSEDPVIEENESDQGDDELTD
jgi:hypothetical protein